MVITHEYFFEMNHSKAKNYVEFLIDIDPNGSESDIFYHLSCTKIKVTLQKLTITKVSTYFKHNHTRTYCA